jgi:AmiR/NasT family two-component response regulator
MTRARILVCEEDDALRRSIVQVLDGAGYEAVHDGQEFDFALLDGPAPGDEMAMARRLGQARVPFVFLSTHQDPAQIHRAVEAGAMGYFVKPLDVAVLLPSIRAWIARAAELRRLDQGERSWLEALRNNRSIGTAVGVIMERHQLTPDHAFDALRRKARSERLNLAQLATRIVAGLDQLEPGPPAA